MFSSLICTSYYLKNTWNSKGVDYDNFCFAYHCITADKNKRPLPKVCANAPNPSVTAAAICRKPYCLQVEKHTPNMVEPLTIFTTASKLLNIV